MNAIICFETGTPVMNWDKMIETFVKVGGKYIPDKETLKEMEDLADRKRTKKLPDEKRNKRFEKWFNTRIICYSYSYCYCYS